MPQQILIGALLIVVVSSLFWLIHIQVPRRIRRRLRERHADWFRNAEAIEACYLSANDLDRSAQILQATQHGYLLIRADSIEFVAARRHGDGVLRIELPRRACRVALFPRTQTAMGVPDLVRVAANGEAHFFCAPMGLLGPARKATAELYEHLRNIAATDSRVPQENRAYRVLLAALAVVPVGLLIAWLFFLVADLTRVSGPELVDVAPNGTVLATSHDELWRFTRDGRADGIWPLPAFGLTEGATDLQALAHNEVLLGDYADGTIQRCRIDTKSCVSIAPLGAAPSRFRRAFKFRLAADGNALFASDTARHTLWRFDLAAATATPLAEAQRGFCFPNAFSENVADGVWLADTNHFRVVHLGLDGKVRAERSSVAASPADYGCRDAAGRRPGGSAFFDRWRDFHSDGKALAWPEVDRASLWVTDVAQSDDGQLWLLLNGKNLRGGDVVRTSATAAADGRLRLALPERADPWSIATRANEVLVADPTAYAIYRFGADGKRLPSLAAAELAERASNAKRKHGRAFDNVTYAVFGALAALLLPIILAWRDRRRRLAELLDLR